MASTATRLFISTDYIMQNAAMNDGIIAGVCNEGVFHSVSVIGLPQKTPHYPSISTVTSLLEMADVMSHETPCLVMLFVKPFGFYKNI